MKFLQAAKVFVCLLTLAGLVQSKLVVYGPQELIDKFNANKGTAAATQPDKKSK